MNWHSSRLCPLITASIHTRYPRHCASIQCIDKFVVKKSVAFGDSKKSGKTSEECTIYATSASAINGQTTFPIHAYLGDLYAIWSNIDKIMMYYRRSLPRTFAPASSMDFAMLVNASAWSLRSHFKYIRNSFSKRAMGQYGRVLEFYQSSTLKLFLGCCVVWPKTARHQQRVLHHCFPTPYFCDVSRRHSDTQTAANFYQPLLQLDPFSTLASISHLHANDVGQPLESKVTSNDSPGWVLTN